MPCPLCLKLGALELIKIIGRKWQFVCHLCMGKSSVPAAEVEETLRQEDMA